MEVDAEYVDKDELLCNISIEDAISYYGREAILDIIGQEYIENYFDLIPFFKV